MRTASPWWASILVAVGLVAIFLGERILGTMAGVRTLLTGAGVVLLVGLTAVRAYTTVSTTGARRRVERTLLLCQVGALLGLFFYALTTKWGLNHFHFTEKGEAKFKTVMTVLWTIVLLGSLVPMFMIEASLGIALRTAFDLKGKGADEGVEYYRVREIGWSGLSIALATSFLFVTCSVAEQRNVSKDVSYFKTSSPGESTKNIAKLSSEPIKVYLFFPDPNEVKEQVRSYFEAIAAAGGKVSVEEHDRFSSPDLVEKFKVSKDGTIVIQYGTEKDKDDKPKFRTIEVDTDIQKAREGQTNKLRNLDGEVNKLLMQLVRDKRKAYVMVGHGEINDPDSVPAELAGGKVPKRRMTAFRRQLQDLNYEIKDLGLSDLARNVPDDATVVILLGPTISLLPAEWAALERYLDKGGRLLVALDPTGAPSLGSLEGKLGYKFNPGSLTDDQLYLQETGGPGDRRLAVTTQISAHASTTALSRNSKGIVLVDSGVLEDAPFTAKGPQPTKTVTIRSMESSFLDLNNNFAFDKDTEKRQRWNLAAAIEGPKMKDADGKDKDGYRVLLFADADLFRDAYAMDQTGRMTSVLVSGPLLRDAVRWLGGEEAYVGEVVSEEDKPIQHTKNQDAVWFLLTIIGAPLVVLTLGLVGTYFRRRRSSTKKTVEVKP